MTKKNLDDILADEDDLGLLTNVRPLASTATSEAQRVRQRFEDICSFIDRTGRKPGDAPSGEKLSASEKLLQLALRSISSDVDARLQLYPFDRHHLLGEPLTEATQVVSLDDILATDDELLTTSADDIFTFTNAPTPRARPDRKTERKQCVDFELFKPLFKACARDLESGRRKTLEFKNEQEIKAGHFFILNGAMIYVAEVNEPHSRNGRPNARLRLIFDNGTEGDNLLRSLSAELYKDGPAGRGRRVTASDDGPLFTGKEESVARETVRGPAHGEAGPSPDSANGEIYVVRSLSTNPSVSALAGKLFKIGFTTGNVVERTLAAKDDPTFLLAPVRPIKSYRVSNIDPVKMENLLHRFFGDARLEIEITDRFGKICKPREWFAVPLDAIDAAIKMLIDGTIVRFQYDRDRGEIVPLSESNCG